MPLKVQSTKINGIVRGILAGISELGEPAVDFVHNPTGSLVIARATVPVSNADVGREAVLMFEDGNVTRPILIGLIGASGKQALVTVDGDRLVMYAQREIVLQCGEASITLTRTGKVIIRGAHLVSRASGVNRIKGGSVQIN